MQNREELMNTLIQGVNAHVTVKGDMAFIIDPVFHIIRNRVHAEFAKTLIRLHQYSYAKKFVNTLLSAQNKDGSWNEIHPNYNEPSALITSIVGETLLMALVHEPDNKILFDSVNRANQYVISCEIEPGYFLKSKMYTADHLNVDATCGAFLARYGSFFNDSSAYSSATRAAERIVFFQKKGWYPYATNKGNYPYILDVPCVHYQGVTIYYLLKIGKILKNQIIDDSLKFASDTLASIVTEDGSFDWSRSGLMFAYHLSGAYAFAYSVFSEMAKTYPQYQSKADKMLEQINPKPIGLLPRWNRSSWSSCLHSIVTVSRVSAIGNFPLKERLFRFSYGNYREFARRRYSKQINTTSFNFIAKAIGVHPSTVDPCSNYPDMFMTTETLDCISSLGGSI